MVIQAIAGETMAVTNRVIKEDKSIIIACDVLTATRLRHIVLNTKDLKGIGGYKTSAAMAEKYGLKDLVRFIRKYTEKPIIHDAQKGCTDVPHTQKDRVLVAQKAGISALIGVPLSGPATQETFIAACVDAHIVPIMGGEMTVEKFKFSEGGYIADEALIRMYTLSANMGVVNFVVPGNKIDRIEYYRKELEPIAAKVSGVQPIFFSPGFIEQGGSISDAIKVAGPNWHPIVGTAIIEAQNVHETAEKIISRLLS